MSASISSEGPGVGGASSAGQAGGSSNKSTSAFTAGYTRSLAEIWKNFYKFASMTRHSDSIIYAKPRKEAFIQSSMSYGPLSGGPPSPDKGLKQPQQPQQQPSQQQSTAPGSSGDVSPLSQSGMLGGGGTGTGAVAAGSDRAIIELWTMMALRYVMCGQLLFSPAKDNPRHTVLDVQGVFKDQWSWQVALDYPSSVIYGFKFTNAQVAAARASDKSRQQTADAAVAAAKAAAAQAKRAQEKPQFSAKYLDSEDGSSPCSGGGGAAAAAKPLSTCNSSSTLKQMLQQAQAPKADGALAPAAGGPSLATRHMESTSSADTHTTLGQAREDSSSASSIATDGDAGTRGSEEDYNEDTAVVSVHSQQTPVSAYCDALPPPPGDVVLDRARADDTSTSPRSSVPGEEANSAPADEDASKNPSLMYLLFPTPQTDQAEATGPANYIPCVGHSLTAMPFDDDSFDVVSAKSLWYFVREDEWAATLAELFRIVRPGGYVEVVVSDYAVINGTPADDYWWSRLRAGVAKSGIDPYPGSRIAGRLYAAGFGEVRQALVTLPRSWGGQVGHLTGFLAMYYSDSLFRTFAGLSAREFEQFTAQSRAPPPPGCYPASSLVLAYARKPLMAEGQGGE